MKNCNFVYTYTKKGMDWHDTYSQRHQILYKGSPFIEDVRACIINQICEDFEDKEINNIIDKNKLIALFNSEINEIQMPMNIKSIDADNNVTAIAPDFWKGENGLVNYENELIITKKDNNTISVLYSAMYGQYNAEREYYSKTIKSSDVVFLPVKSRYRCLRDGNTIEWIDSDMFTSYENAVSFVKNDIINETLFSEGFIKKTSNNSRYDNYEVMVFNKNELKKNQWYLLNMENIKRRDKLVINEFSRLYTVIPTLQKELLDKYERFLKSLGSKSSLFEDYRFIVDCYKHIIKGYEARLENVNRLENKYGKESDIVKKYKREIDFYENSIDYFKAVKIIPFVNTLKNKVIKNTNIKNLLYESMQKYDKEFYSEFVKKKIK